MSAPSSARAPESLQVYNRGTRGGVYWYRAGRHIRATPAWALGSAVVLLGVDTPLHRGPLLPLTGGIDLSFLLAAAVGGTAYLILTVRDPRPVAVLRALPPAPPAPAAEAPAEVG
ncbi:cytosine permease [Streptomyces tubercidicus]|uniref:cytosine permease n=1 Tax=Streptomyces tubercidicus TaxID=47759 RepID=UPI00378A6C04